MDLPNYLGAVDDSGVSSAVLETVKNGAGAALDACSDGVWQNFMVYADSAGESTLDYPVYYVSGSSHPYPSSMQ